LFGGTINNVLFGQAIVIYVSPKYRLGILFQAPKALFETATFQRELETFFTSGVTLPQ
jgi:hypothetical protein